MGLAWFIVWWNGASCGPGTKNTIGGLGFWAKIFGPLPIFAVGVVTGSDGVQFGTNWADFSKYCRLRNRQTARDGRNVRVSSGERVSLSAH